jgi:hypothetical protein
VHQARRENKEENDWFRDRENSLVKRFGPATCGGFGATRAG